MKSLFTASFIVLTLRSGDALQARSNLYAILGGGPYATVTDVKRGSVCVLNESKAGNDAIPSECECSFQRLQSREQECATLALSASNEKSKKCTEVPCEICCVLKYNALQGF